MKDRYKAIILIAIFFGAMFYIFNGWDRKEWIESTFYDLYYVEAPFGILWVETDGVFFLACGGISSDLSESYVAKYFNGEELQSKNLDASKTSIIIDGTFRLEYRVHYSGSNHYYGWIQTSYKKYSDHPPRWFIHLPELPELTETINAEPNKLGD